MNARPQLGLAIMAAMAAATAVATDGRYREYVVGTRTGGMGGAGIAVASDVDAIFYNPAGIAKSQGDSISLSANLYGTEHYRKKRSLDWGVDDSSSSFVTIPGAMGGVSRISDELVAGYGVFTPKNEKRHLIAASSDGMSFANYDINDQTLWLGPSIGWSPKDSRFSFGAGIFGVYRDYSTSESDFRRNAMTLNGALDLKTLGLLAAVGVQADLNDGWRAGATIQTPTIRIWDDGALSISGSSMQDDYSIGVHTTDVRADNCIPWSLAAGIGRTVPDKWGFAFDAIYHPSKSFDLARWNIDGVTDTMALHLHSVLDFSLGGEYIIAGSYPIRAGVYTAFSAIEVPDEPSNNDFATSDVDMYGATFSIGKRNKRMSVDLGLDVAFGHGHDQSYNDAGDMVRVSCDRRVVLATIGTTYYF